MAGSTSSPPADTRTGRRWTRHCAPPAPDHVVVDSLCCQRASDGQSALDSSAGLEGQAGEGGGPTTHTVNESSLRSSDQSISTAGCGHLRDQAWRSPDAQASTADSWNRRRDKSRVEGELGLPESGAAIELYDASSPTTLVAHGYTRVVYGDHGSYIEFESSQIEWESLPIAILKPPHAYYDEYHSEGGFVQLYVQKRSVENKRNPPKGGVWHNREGGYADYKVGMCYISSDMLTVSRTPIGCSAASSSGRRWAAR